MAGKYFNYEGLFAKDNKENGFIDFVDYDIDESSLSELWDSAIHGQGFDEYLYEDYLNLLKIAPKKKAKLVKIKPEYKNFYVVSQAYHRVDADEDYYDKLILATNNSYKPDELKALVIKNSDKSWADFDQEGYINYNYGVRQSIKLNKDKLINIIKEIDGAKNKNSFKLLTIDEDNNFLLIDDINRIKDFKK